MKIRRILIASTLVTRHLALVAQRQFLSMSEANVTYRYVLYNVAFCSDVPLALPSAPTDQLIRIEILDIRSAESISSDDVIIQTVRDDWTALHVYKSGMVQIEWKNWLAIWISRDGRTVRYKVDEKAYPTAFEAYIANFAISAALLLQGEETLHATVVEFKGCGIGLLGDSGSGKSTLAAHMLGLGADLVTDDMLRITETDGVRFAEPGQPRLKLLREAAERHFGGVADHGRWNPVSEKYLFDTHDLRSPRKKQRLDVLVWLAPPDDARPDAVHFKQVIGLEMFKVLAGSTMNSKLQTSDRLARQLRYTEWVGAKTPVYELRYPRRHDVFTAVVETILGARIRLQ